jgi:hypothetical protein
MRIARSLYRWAAGRTGCAVILAIAIVMLGASAYPRVKPVAVAAFCLGMLSSMAEWRWLRRRARRVARTQISKIKMYLELQDDPEDPSRYVVFCRFREDIQTDVAAATLHTLAMKFAAVSRADDPARVAKMN